MVVEMESEKLDRGLRLKGIFRKTGKPAKLFLGIFLLLTLSAGAAAIIFMKNGREKRADVPFEKMPEEGQQFPMAEGMTVGSGVTGVGITEELFEVENLSAKLEIEEVYIGAEDIVEKGDKVLKLSDESIAQAREELEKAQREANLAYRAGKIEYEQSKITLRYERDSKLLSGEQAKAVYEETLSSLQDAVDQAEKEVEEAGEEIAEYRSYVSDASYESYFKVDEYQNAYDETLDALKDKMDEWGVSWSQVTGGSGSANRDSAGASASGSAGSGGMSGNDPNEENISQSAEPSKDQIEVLASLYKVLEKEAKKLEQAESDCEDAVVNGIFELQTLELKLPELEQKLTEAKKNYEAEVLQAKVTYEKALANAESAQSDYEAALRKAETNYEKLKSDWEDAEENLALFESSVGDGCYYASDSGTVLRTMVREAGELSAEDIIFVYSNPKEMTASVSINQTDIAKIALEDAVYIQTENGGYEGIVTQIDPISASDSRNNVSYSVTVKFADGTEGVSANESVVVVFGMDEEAIREAISAAGQSGQGRSPGKEQIPGKEQASGEKQTSGEKQASGEKQVSGEKQTSGEKQISGEEQVSGNEGGRRRP